MRSNLEQLKEGWRPLSSKPVKRTNQTYIETLDLATFEIERLVNLYRARDFCEDQTNRLYRDKMDHWLRRYQSYCIKQKIESHYNQCNVSLANKDCTFEHVIPAGQVVWMLIRKELTTAQALNVPTCRLSKQDDKNLTKKGLVKLNLEPYFPFRRYLQVNKTIEIETCNGEIIKDLSNYTLLQHFDLFDIS